MQLQPDIAFQELVQLAKKLPKNQWSKLKDEVENENSSQDNSSELESFLLTAPIFTKEQLEEIELTRKEINQWRSK